MSTAKILNGDDEEEKAPPVITKNVYGMHVTPLHK